PFLPLRPNVYAQMLGRKIEEHKANVYLINTGWVGGSYGEGKRMNLAYTRAMVTAALNGSLENTTFTKVPFFGLLCPDAVPGVPSELLLPRNTWQDQSQYDVKAKELAQRFIHNFQKFDGVDERIIAAGPKI
ncbi:phosphoenolpyruvate carboxykinase (ATP), partial [Paenibacillus sp. TAF58]